MESALSWTSTNANHPLISILFCTDSKSLCEALISSNPRTSSIHNSISSISSSIFIQGIPGHSAIPGNDLADKAVKEAITIAINTILPVFFSSSIQVINETIRYDPPAHNRVVLICKHQKTSRDTKQIKNRKDDVLLACLQCGHHPSLQQHLHRHDPSKDPICPKFRLAEQDLFGNHKGALEWLATQPGDVVAYARKTLVNLDA